LADWPYNIPTSHVFAADTQVDYTTSNLTLITTGAVAHTKTAWSEVCASTPFAVSAFILRTITYYEGDYFTDVAIGSSGNETIIVNNAYGGNPYYLSAPRQPYDFFFPVAIPEGTRISMRVQSIETARDFATQIILIGSAGLHASYSKVTTYGADTSDTGGVEIDPGAVANTKGSWTEITSSTNEQWGGFILTLGGKNNTTRDHTLWLLDLAIGGSGSEVILIPDYGIGNVAAMDRVAPVASSFFPVFIPKGTRISVRAQCDLTDATDRLFDVIIYGVS
jgi:hypothetical protein